MKKNLLFAASLILASTLFFSPSIFAQTTPTPNLFPALGNIGIGTILPQEKLHIKGNVRLDSSLVIKSKLRVDEFVIFDSSLTVNGPTQLNKLSINLDSDQSGSNYSNLGSFKIQNLPLLNDTISQADYFLKIDENGNIYRKVNAPLADPLVGLDDCFPTSPLRLTPQWMKGTDKLYTACPDIRVGIGTNSPNFQFEITRDAHVNYLSVGYPATSDFGNNPGAKAMRLKSIVSETSNLAQNVMVEFGNYNRPVFQLTHSGAVVFSSNVTAPQSVPNLSYVFTVENNQRKLMQIDNSGLMHAREIKVDLSNAWPDYVFSPNYELIPLSMVESYISKYNHLPGFPSAEELENSGGIELGETNRLLTEKVEELTLYLIQLEKRIKELETQIEKQ